MNPKRDANHPRTQDSFIQFRRTGRERQGWGTEVGTVTKLVNIFKLFNKACVTSVSATFTCSYY